MRNVKDPVMKTPPLALPQQSWMISMDLDGSGWIDHDFTHKNAKQKNKHPKPFKKHQENSDFTCAMISIHFWPFPKCKVLLPKQVIQLQLCFARFQKLRTSSSCRSLTPQQLRQLRSIRIQQQSIVVTLRDTWRFSDQIQIRFHHEKSSLTRVD